MLVVMLELQGAEVETICMPVTADVSMCASAESVYFRVRESIASM